MSSSRPRIIGLTGGIATGKTTVSKYLHHQHHCQIHDADLIAREAVEKTSPIFNQIVQRYGQSIINQAGDLDRPQLGSIIFHNSTEKAWLESLIHPYVRNQLELRIEKSQNRQTTQEAMPCLCLVVPLLFESKMENLTPEIWVVSCHPQQQQERLMTRNQLSLADAKARIQSQWPLPQKIARADVVIHNNGDRDQLYAQIDEAFTRFR